MNVALRSHQQSLNVTYLVAELGCFLLGLSLVRLLICVF